jgi:hypothetical protein
VRDAGRRGSCRAPWLLLWRSIGSTCAQTARTGTAASSCVHGPPFTRRPSRGILGHHRLAPPPRGRRSCASRSSRRRARSTVTVAASSGARSATGRSRSRRSPPTCRPSSTPAPVTAPSSSTPVAVATPPAGPTRFLQVEGERGFAGCPLRRGGREGAGQDHAVPAVHRRGLPEAPGARFASREAIHQLVPGGPPRRERVVTEAREAASLGGRDAAEPGGIEVIDLKQVRRAADLAGLEPELAAPSRFQTEGGAVLHGLGRRRAGEWLRVPRAGRQGHGPRVHEVRAQEIRRFHGDAERGPGGACSRPAPRSPRPAFEPPAKA